MKTVIRKRLSNSPWWELQLSSFPFILRSHRGGEVPYWNLQSRSFCRRQVSSVSVTSVFLSFSFAFHFSASLAFDHDQMFELLVCFMWFSDRADNVFSSSFFSQAHFTENKPILRSSSSPFASVSRECDFKSQWHYLVYENVEWKQKVVTIKKSAVDICFKTTIKWTKQALCQDKMSKVLTENPNLWNQRDVKSEAATSLETTNTARCTNIE